MNNKAMRFTSITSSQTPNLGSTLRHRELPTQWVRFTCRQMRWFTLGLAKSPGQLLDGELARLGLLRQHAPGTRLRLLGCPNTAGMVAGGNIDKLGHGGAAGRNAQRAARGKRA